MGAVSSLSAKIRGLFRRSPSARNDTSPGHEAADMGEIVHERAIREAEIRRGADSGGNTPNSSSYF